MLASKRGYGCRIGDASDAVFQTERRDAWVEHVAETKQPGLLRRPGQREGDRMFARP
jgi:hypothetical protein